MSDISQSEVIAGVVIVTPDVHGDNRGCLIETWRKEWVPGSADMIQANRADRRKDALVGLHYHRYQADFWYVPFGQALVALHDLRLSSPTEGATLTLEIGESNHRALYIPPGVAHGFYALTDMTITYLVDHYYDTADELGVAWNDPDLGIEWPGTSPELSGRDRANPKRSDIPHDLRPTWDAK